MGTQIMKKLDVGIVVDTSSSLFHQGDVINKSLVQMIENIKEQPYLSGCDVTLTIISFANGFAKNLDFAPINSIPAKSLDLEFNGGTNPGPALLYFVDESKKRYEKYKQNGQVAFHPMLFFFTDGNPEPLEEYVNKYEETASYIKSLVDNNKILVVCAGFGRARKDNLEKLTYPELVIMNPENNIEKLQSFFTKIIPQSTNWGITKGYDQVAGFIGALSDF